MKKQLFRYLFSGILTVILDVITLILLTKIGINPVIGVAINQVFVMLFNFSLNKMWSFSDNQKPHGQILKYSILAAGNYLFGINSMHFFYNILNFDYRVVRLFSIALSTLWTFPLYKYWVYKKQ